MNEIKNDVTPTSRQDMKRKGEKEGRKEGRILIHCSICPTSKVRKKVGGCHVFPSRLHIVSGPRP